MGHSLGVRGQRGRIKVGHQMAAQLGAFTLSPLTPGVWQVEAAVLSADAFWVSQDNRTLELEVGQQRWLWRDAHLVVGDGTVHGTVNGRPERR